jgi:hypothetical protein
MTSSEQATLHRWTFTMGRAGAYLAALRDLEVLAREDLDGVFLVLDRLYQAQFSRLGMLGAL